MAPVSRLIMGAAFADNRIRRKLPQAPGKDGGPGKTVYGPENLLKRSPLLSLQAALPTALFAGREKIQTPVKLVLAGGSSYSDSYTRELRNRQNENIRFLDWVSGDVLDESLTNATLFVLPSDIEGLSLALLDAMGAGVCVLTSDIAENCELVEGAGFTFKRGDVNDLERMLRWLISDSSARSTAADKAQQRVREHYLWPGIAVEVERAYWRIMGREDVRAGAAAITTWLGGLTILPKIERIGM